MIDRDTDGGPATQIVEHTYDYLNRWVARAVDSDGDGALGSVDTYFVYDGTPGAVSLDRAEVSTDNVGQIVLQFDDDAQGTPQLTHRYLWGPAVDQILADEQVTDLLVEGEVLWALTDHLGTVRDLAQYDPATSTTTVVNHRTFTSFGELISETNSSVDHLFAFTGRPLDTSTSLQNNLNRWYDTQTGRWLSEDPIGFAAGDMNLHRYVGNNALTRTDPSGLLWRHPAGLFLRSVWDWLSTPGEEQADLLGKDARVAIESDKWDPTWKSLPRATVYSRIGSNGELIEALEEHVKSTGFKIRELHICGHASSRGGVVYRVGDFSPESLTDDQIRRLKAVLHEDATITIWGCVQGSEQYAPKMKRLAELLDRGVWASPLQPRNAFVSVDDTYNYGLRARFQASVLPGSWTGAWVYFDPRPGPPPYSSWGRAFENFDPKVFPLIHP